MIGRRGGRRWVVVLALTVVASGCASGASDAGAPAPSAPDTSTSASPTAGASTPVAVPPSPSGGCGRPADVASVDASSRPGDVAQELQVGGAARTYRLGVPASYDPGEAAPLVVNLHGSGSNGLQASAYGDVARAAAARGMLTVAPDAIGGRWELAAEGDDAEFLDALVSEIESRYCVDRNRVHLVGMSLGAWKSAVTACADAGRYASVSLVTVEVFPGTCEPLPVVAFHGRADRTVPYGDGGEVDRNETTLSNLPGVQENIARWAENGGCDVEPVRTQLGDDVEVQAYEGCDDGVDVVLYSIDGGGHTWPGADIALGPASATTDTIDATEITLDWFEDHPRRA